MNVLEIFGVLLNASGACLVASKRARTGQIVWCFGNPMLLVVYAYRGLWPSCLLFAFYWCISAYGVWRWSRT